MSAETTFLKALIGVGLAFGAAATATYVVTESPPAAAVTVQKPEAPCQDASERDRRNACTHDTAILGVISGLGIAVIGFAALKKEQQFERTLGP